MGTLWDEECERRYEWYRHSMEAWELLHEEEGFEDTGPAVDLTLSDFDGAETHLHLVHLERS